MSTSPWRTDATIAGGFRADLPDDLQVVVHDGEPRRTQKGPEGCWVRATGVHATLKFPVMRKDTKMPLHASAAQWIERTVYRGTLLNQPHHLTETRKDGEVLFLHAPGLPHPLQVRAAYLAERARWAFAPCDKCGADQALDPPTVMAKTRFPDAPGGAVPIAFSAFCVCGGTMMLTLLEGAIPEAAAPPTEKKPWWKFW